MDRPGHNSPRTSLAPYCYKCPKIFGALTMANRVVGNQVAVGTVIIKCWDKILYFYDGSNI